MNLLDTKQFLAALNERGEVIGEDGLVKNLRPILVVEGDAQAIGEGRRATWVFDGNRAWYWREYLHKRKALIELGYDKWHSKRPYDAWDANLLIDQAVFDGELDHPIFSLGESDNV